MYQVPCYAGQHTQCPGSSSQCAGDQCCPGIKWSGGKTFVCPSASSIEASNCAFPYKAWYCTAPAGHAALPQSSTGEAALLQSRSSESATGADLSFPMYQVSCYAGESTQCPGSSSQCAGNQCCPGIEWSGNKTFVCPSATSIEASNCAFPYKAWYCVWRRPSRRHPRPCSSIRVALKLRPQARLWLQALPPVLAPPPPSPPPSPLWKAR